MSKFEIRLGMPNRRTFIAATSALAVSSLFASAQQSAHAAGGLQNLKFGSSAIVNFAAIYHFKNIAKDFGFAVDLVNFPSGTERLNALAAGYIHGSPTGSSQPIILRAKGVPVKIVCDVVRKGKGLMVGDQIQNFADLKGKDIGTVRGSTSDIWLRQKLIDEKLDPDSDVNLVNMDYLQMPAAVLSGRVTAASGAEPLIASFEAKGGRVLSYLTDTKLGDIDAVLCLLDAFVERDRPLAKAIVAGMAKASQDLQRDPDLVIQTMASVVKLDTEIIRRSLTNLAFTVKPDAAALGNLAEVLHNMKMIDRLPPIDEYLDLSLGQ